jgi:hypothetical protein
LIIFMITKVYGERHRVCMCLHDYKNIKNDYGLIVRNILPTAEP